MMNTTSETFSPHEYVVPALDTVQPVFRAYCKEAGLTEGASWKSNEFMVWCYQRIAGMQKETD